MNTTTKKKKKNNTSTTYSTFAILFYINRQKVKKNGMCPLMGRISINAEIAQFSAGLDVDPKLWDAKAYRLTGRSHHAAEANYLIKQLTEKINRYYRQILDEQGYITAELIKNAVGGIGRKKENLLELFREHNDEYAKQVDNLEHTHPISGIKSGSFSLYLSVKSLPICLIPTQKVS